MATIIDGRNKRLKIGKTMRRTSPIPVLPPRIPTPMPNQPKDSSSKLKIAKYEKTYQSSIAARMLLFTTDSEKDNEKRIVNYKQQQPPPSSLAAAVPCHRRCRADEEGEDRQRRRTSAVAVPPLPNGGGRSSAANPEQSARSRTHRTDDTHALYAAAAAKVEDEVRRLTRGCLPLPTTDVEAVALEYRRRRYGMYATASVTADDRYGHRYGLSSGLTTSSQDPKTSSAAAAFFL
ncbi:PREDICTED: uncharacterized protein LOC107171261, partial [Diuraphis noxia]|uniref:uncharacterized protein LOC107171261 n=1 Tax=Diuraphis noxia TaxID=143948 RepID=UPI0007636276